MVEYIYILYNDCYGGYSMNEDFIIELFKRYPESTEIGGTIFKMDDIKNENDINNKDLNIEYFMHYKITKNKIINMQTNKYYFISPFCTELRDNQYLIDYIFERTLMKIIKNNDPTPYFYNELFQLDKDKFSQEITAEQIGELIELEHIKQKDILDFVPEIITIGQRHRRRNRQNQNNIINIKNNIYFYKNGFKQNDTYYKFKFNMNITKDNLYDIITSIDIDENLLNRILFDDINGNNSLLSIIKIKKIYNWKIREYDGTESVILNLPTDDLIDDLLNKIWETKDYKPKCKLTELLINKNKNLKELKQEIYN
jgi:hypothetical protein